MKIINCANEDIIKKVPNIFNILERYFDNQEVLIFVCLDDNKLSFIGRRGNYCVYIDGDRVIPFGIRDNDTINFYSKDGFNLFPNGLDSIKSDVPCCQDSKGVLHSVVSYPMEYEDGVNGAFSYFQYSQKKDALCEIRYRHFFREDKEVSPIYSYYLNKKMESVSINRNYSKHIKFDYGMIPSSFHHYELFNPEKDTLGYGMVSISENGLYNTFVNGSYNLIQESVVNRYIKSIYIKKDGTIVEMIWPFCKFYKEEEIMEELDSLGFGNVVPNVLLKLYNGEDTDKLLIEKLISLMDEVVKSDDNSKVMLLRRKV